MFIRQRRTILDPFLLKIVCPFLRSRGHYGMLAILVSFWNPMVDATMPEHKPRSVGEMVAQALPRALAGLTSLLWPLSTGRHSS